MALRRQVRTLYDRNMTRFIDALTGSHVRLWLLAVLAIVAIGTAGYVMLGWPLDDAAYMTGITLTTVGFKEVRELDDFGRAWTVALAVAGIGIIFGSIGIVAEAVLSETVSGRREARRMAEQISGLRGHLILCGYGRVGSTVARELAHVGQPFVVVDINPESLGEATRDGHLVVEGDATNDDVLRAAGVERARGLITTIDFGRPQRLRDPLGPGLESRTLRRRAGQPGWRRGEAPPGRGEPGRVPVHAGGSPDRRARHPPAGRRLHRLGPVARRTRVLARRARGGARRAARRPNGRVAARGRDLRARDRPR